MDMATNAMNYLQFLIFITSLVFTSSQNDFFKNYGWKDGIEAFEISTLPAIREFGKKEFPLCEEFSYILLRTEYVELESTDKEEQEVNFSYHLYYIISTTQSNYEVGVQLTVDYLTTFYQYLKNRSKLPVTITRDKHKIESNEVRLLLPFDNTRNTSKYISNQWRQNQKIKCEDKLLSRLYKLTSSPNIMEVPPLWDHVTFESFVGYYSTKLIAFRSANPELQKYTKNFVNFIRRCSSEKLEIYEVDFYDNLFQRDYYITNGGRYRDEQYELHKYDEKCKRLLTFRLEKSTSYPGTSQHIKKNGHYILEDLRMNELHIFIKPSIDISTLNCLLKQELNLHPGRRNYKITVFQSHQLNISFLIAFVDLVEDILNDNVTDNMRRFITVCRNPITEFPGSSSSVPN